MNTQNLFETEITIEQSTENTEYTEKTLEQIFEEVTELNGEETEEGLNMAIAQELIRERKKQNLLTTSITRLDSEVDKGEKLEKGVYVYQNEDLFSWNFDRYDTMADAVRAAVLLVNATIIYNGEEVIYDALSDVDAYYINNETNKVMLVTLK